MHWDENMQSKSTIKPPASPIQKADREGRPHSAMAPTPPLARAPMLRPSTSSSGRSLVLDSQAMMEASSDSAESDSGETDSESSCGSESDVEDESSHGASLRMYQASGRFPPDSDQVPWGQLPDRCLRPLSKLQQPSFMPSGKAASPKAEPGGLIWQNSGFMMPFTPELLTVKHGQIKQISSSATGISTLLDSGMKSYHTLPAIAILSSQLQHLCML